MGSQGSVPRDAEPDPDPEPHPEPPDSVPGSGANNKVILFEAFYLNGHVSPPRTA